MTDDISRLASTLADRYTIESMVGEGGMATVYRARDQRHDRAVAIKVLRPELAAVIGAERFLAEIRTTANLQHPHILPLHDSGEAAGSVFYVMPFVEGESLRDRLLRETQLPVADAVQLVIDVAGALDYAHRHGVIHRDIKPENILLHDGRAVVADFGIALAATSAGKRMTETGMSLGTPSYMSPEQAMGERALDARTDVYALGCVLYETLVGAPPFVGPTAQSIVAKVLTERPQPPSASRDTISDAIDAVVLKALAKVPADRQPSAAVFAEELRQAARAQGATRSGARTAETVDGARDPRLRTKLALATVVGAAMTAAIFLGLSALAGGNAPYMVGERSQLTFEGRAAEVAISADGKFVSYTVARCDRNTGGPCDLSLQLQEVGGEKPVMLVEHAELVVNPRFSADGSQIIFGARFDAERIGIYAIPKLGGAPRLVTPRVGRFDLHPRADSLVVLRGAWAYVIDLAVGSVRDSFALRYADPDRIAWSPDGRRFAVTRNYAGLAILARDGTVTDTLTRAIRPAVRWNADSRHVLAVLAREGVVDDLVRIAVDEDGRLSPTLEVLLAKESLLLRGEFDIADDAGRLVVIRGPATFDLWRFPLSGNGEPEQMTQGTAYYGNPSLAPDGKSMYFARGDALGDNLYVVGPDGSERALTREPYVAGANAYIVGPDGRRVMFSQTTPAGVRLSEMRLPTGEVRHSRHYVRLGVTRDAVPFGSRGYVRVAPGGAALEVLDSLDAEPRRIGLDGGRVAVRVVGDRGNDAVVAVGALRGTPGQDLLRVPIDGSAQTLLLHLEGPFAEVMPRDDGSIWFSRRIVGERSSLWELARGSRTPVRRTALPAACRELSVTVAAAAPVAACLAIDARGDVWLMETLTRSSR